MAEKVILKKDDIDKIINENSIRILSDINSIDELAIVGVQTRGVELANRLKSNIERMSGREIKSGFVDITFYRDDLATRGELPVIKETRIDFPISGLTILLVDDVIFTGRTVKAAMETLTGFGRPHAIRLFALIDRGNRELPIQPDYMGLRIETTIKDNIQVLLSGMDGVEDSVLFYKG